MEKERNNKGLIAALLVIIVLLAVLCVLFATGTISLKGNNDNSNQNNQNIEINNAYDALAIAKEKMPVVLSFINQSNGVYTYCGQTVKSDMTKGILLYSKSTQFKTVDQLKEYLSTIMTEDIINKYFVTEEEKYIEQDGQLYCAFAPADGLAIHYKSEELINKLDNLSYNISNKTDNSFNATMTFTYSSAIEEVTDKLYTFDATFIKENNNWIINTFVEN